MKKKRHPTAKHKPIRWICYVDNMFVICIWPHGDEELCNFHDHLKNLSPNIQFTIKKEKDGQIPFLDVLVTGDGDHLSTTVNCKPTHTDQYSHPFNSRARVHRICNNEGNRWSKMEHTQGVFQANGFRVRSSGRLSQASQEPVTLAQSHNHKQMPQNCCVFAIHLWPQ